jgi:hypothetical protein
MQLIARAALACLWLWLCVTGAGACTVGISTPGVLKLSSDGHTLGSGNSGGVASVLAISDLDLDLNGTTITISNTRLDTTPPGFAAPVSYAATYSAAWLLSGASGSLASNPSFTVPPVLNLVVTLTLHNTVTSATGFKQGNYTTKTTITCS